MKLISRVNGQVSRVLSRLGVSVVEVGIGSVDGAIAVYERNPNVIYAEPNFSRPLFRPVTTEGAEPALGISNNFDEQWGLPQRRAGIRGLHRPP